MEKSIRPVGINREEILVPLCLCLYICVTNLGNAIFAFPYVVFCLCYILYRPAQYAVGILLVNMVYLGYSYINIYPYVGISNYGFTHLCYAAVVLRAIIRSDVICGRISLNFRDIPVVLLMGYIIFRHFSISAQDGFYTSFLLLCVWYILRELKKECNQKIFALQLTAVVLSVFVYYVFQHNVYTDFNGARFSGTRDPNNFALWCNVGLVFINGFNNGLPTKYRTAINAILAIGVLCTVSVSGLATMLVITLVLMPKNSRRGVTVLVVLGLIITLVIFAIQLLPSEVIMSVGGFGERLVNIVQSLQAGDLSTATTGRYGLWEYYMEYFMHFDLRAKIFGNQFVIQQISSKGVLAAHNAYIDFLLNYGYFGVGLLLYVIAYKVLGHMKRKEKALALLNLVMTVNMFFRSFSGIFVWLNLLI